MDELEKFNELFLRFMNKYHKVNPVHGNLEDVAGMCNGIDWFVKHYKNDEPMSHFVEDCAFAFLNYLEEKNGISRAEIEMTHLRHLQSVRGE